MPNERGCLLLAPEMRQAVDRSRLRRHHQPCKRRVLIISGEEELRSGRRDMSTSVYIAGTGPAARKSVVVIGVMELLVRHGRKLGFFRPLVEGGDLRIS